MAFIPPTIGALRQYLARQTGRELKYFSVARSNYSSPSYHLGADQITRSGRTARNDYTIRTTRDRAGLSDARSALDINLGAQQERALFDFLIRQCRANAPGTSDIREVIGSSDGQVVLRWDRERGVTSRPQPGEADNSHLWHIHMSWYRDSEFRDKVGVFRPFFGSAPAPAPAPEDDVTQDEVKLLQRTINELGHRPALVVDGILGPNTRAGLAAAPALAQSRKAALVDIKATAEGALS